MKMIWLKELAKDLVGILVFALCFVVIYIYAGIEWIREINLSGNKE